MALFDLLNRLGLFLDRSNFGVRVGNFRTRDLSQNTILTQNARLQAIRAEKQFDLDRGNKRGFEEFQRPLFEENFLNPINQQIKETNNFVKSLQSILFKVNIDRSTADFLNRSKKRPVSFNQLSPNQQRKVEMLRANRQFIQTTINPVRAFQQRLNEIRTSETNRINDIFKLVAPNSSI